MISRSRIIKKSSGSCREGEKGTEARAGSVKR